MGRRKRYDYIDLRYFRTEAEIAEQFGVAKRTIQRWRLSGRLLPNPCWCGRIRLWRRPGIDVWIASEKRKLRAEKKRKRLEALDLVVGWGTIGLESVEESRGKRNADHRVARIKRRRPEVCPADIADVGAGETSGEGADWNAADPRQDTEAGADPGQHAAWMGEADPDDLPGDRERELEARAVRVAMALRKQNLAQKVRNT